MTYTHTTQPIEITETAKETYTITIKTESHMFDKSELRELLQIIDNAIL